MGNGTAWPFEPISPAPPPVFGQAWTPTAAMDRQPFLLGKQSSSRITSPFFVLGVPNAQHGNKIRSGYLAPANSGAQKWAHWLHNPGCLGDPQRQARGRNEKWLLDHRRLGGPKHIGCGNQLHHL